MSSQEPGKRTTPNFIALSRTPRSADSSADAHTSREAAPDPRRPTRSAGPRARCARPRNRALEARVRPLGPADRGFPLWAGRGPGPSSGPLAPVVEGLAGDAFVSLDVLLTGARDHVLR